MLQADPAVHVRALRRALASGFISSHDVVQWLDHQIEAVDVPPAALIDASLAEYDKYRLLGALEELAASYEDASSADVCKVLMSYLGLWFAQHPKSGASIARLLFQMALDDDFPDDDAQGSMYRLDDAYDLATHGIAGSPEQADAELKEFLSRYLGCAE